MDIEQRVKNLIEACENVTNLSASGGYGGQQYAYWNRAFEEAKKNLVDDVKGLDAENARLREAARWIPVEERLPKDAGDYLVLCPEFPVCIVWFQRGTFDEDDVTHWMPLPETPEETR